MYRMATIVIVIAFMSLNGHAYGAFGGNNTLTSGVAGSSPTLQSMPNTVDIGTTTTVKSVSLGAGSRSAYGPIINPSPSLNPVAHMTPAAGNDGDVQTTAVNNVSPHQYLSAWLSCGSIFMLLLAWFLSHEAARLQRWAMADQKEDRPKTENAFFVVLGVALFSCLLSLLIWMCLEGQYLPGQLRGEAFFMAILFNPYVLAPGFLMASIVTGALALVRFSFASVALRLRGAGQGEGMRSPWMALGGGLIALINVAGAVTGLLVVFWPHLLHL
ncbi:MAG TPA: hypothetical protein VMU29_02590 [Smithella sp.]|nr:hypothetical protein [Smithella sp.]